MATEDSIEFIVEILIHASACDDSECKLDYCHKMKRVVAHTRLCEKRAEASCPVCKQLIALCCYHSKTCQQGRCSVPFCMNLRMRRAALHATRGPPAAA